MELSQHWSGMKSTVANLSLDRQKVVILAVICLVIITATAWIINRYPALSLKSDFYVRWYAVDRLYHEGRNLYDYRNGDDVDMMRGGPNASDSGMDFYYPAHVLLFIAPLGLLSYETANLIWLIVIQIFYLAGLAIMMWARKWPPTMNQATIFLLAALFSVPAFQHSIYGQFNTIGILSLSLTYLAVDRERYGLAGLFAVGLTFKTHAYILTLAFLFVWVISNRKRWRFLLYFSAAALFAWLFAEIFQSGWVPDFFLSLGRYSDLRSIADMIWNPYQVVAGALILASLVIFWRNRHADLQSSAFSGSLALSLAVWSIVFPFAFTFHVLILVLAIILVASSYRIYIPNLYRQLLIMLAVLYFAVWIGVVLAQPNVFGLIAYKITLPIVIIIAALPLCLDYRVADLASEHS